MKILIYDDSLNDIQILKKLLNNYAALNSIEFLLNFISNFQLSA